MLGVVFVEPAPPDAVLMTVIAVAIATGRFTLRRVPAPVLLLLSAFLLLNLISTVFADDSRRAAMYLLITTYLCLLALWVSGFVDSPRRGRVIIAPLIAGAVITAAIGVAVLFVGFPGSTILDFSDGFRARGFFKDPNVFGPFCVFAELFVVSELLEPRLLQANRALKLFCLIILALATLFAYSRAAWLNAAVATTIMIVAYVLRRGGGRKAVAMLVTLVVLAGIGSVTLAATGSGPALLRPLRASSPAEATTRHRFSLRRSKGRKLAGALHPLLRIGPGRSRTGASDRILTTLTWARARRAGASRYCSVTLISSSRPASAFGDTERLVIGRDTRSRRSRQTTIGGPVRDPGEQRLRGKHASTGAAPRLVLGLILGWRDAPCRSRPSPSHLTSRRLTGTVFREDVRQHAPSDSARRRIRTLVGAEAAQTTSPSTFVWSQVSLSRVSTACSTESRSGRETSKRLSAFSGDRAHRRSRATAARRDHVVVIECRERLEDDLQGAAEQELGWVSDT